MPETAPAREERVVPVTTADGIACNVINVRRAKAPTKPPVLLVHGAGVRANIFRAPTDRPHARRRAGALRIVATWDDVAEIGCRLPGVEVGTSYGTPALRVRKKGMCRMRSDPAALVVRVTDMGEREALLQGDRGVFFTTPHYDGYPYVLVRLEAVDPVELGELLEDAWRVFAGKRAVAAWDAQQAGQ